MEQGSSCPSVGETSSETKSGSRSRQYSMSETGSLCALPGLPTGSLSDNTSTEGAHADDSDEKGDSVDPRLQNVMSLPSDNEEKEPETVLVKTVSRFHCRS